MVEAAVVVEAPALVLPRRKRLPNEIAELLGPDGIQALEKVFTLLRREVPRQHWPLTCVEVRKVSDPEVEGFEYALVVLKLKTSFARANKILQQFYKALQEFADGLSATERAVLTKSIYFDVAVP